MRHRTATVLRRAARRLDRDRPPVAVRIDGKAVTRAVAAEVRSRQARQ